MRLHGKTRFVKMTSAKPRSVKTMPAKLTFTFLLFGVLIGASVPGFAQNRAADQTRPSIAFQAYQRALNEELRASAQGRYPGSPESSPYAATNFTEIFDKARHEEEQSSTYQDLVRRQRARAAQEAAIRSRSDEDDFQWYRENEPQAQASPDAPDQSELLKNSRDHDFILRNFRTMYVDARDAKYFSSALMKGALGKNKEFERLKIRIVDDRRVADVVLTVSYTFAWEYPFELMHQNTTVVLLSGKGEGPFSGPLGAADVARNFVNMAKPWREEKKAEEKPHH